MREAPRRANHRTGFDHSLWWQLRHYSDRRTRRVCRQSVSESCNPMTKTSRRLSLLCALAALAASCGEEQSYRFAESPGFWHEQTPKTQRCDVESEACRAAARLWEPSRAVLVILTPADHVAGAATTASSCASAGLDLLVITDSQDRMEFAIDASGAISVAPVSSEAFHSVPGLARALLAAMDDPLLQEARRFFWMPSNTKCTPEVLAAIEHPCHARPLQHGNPFLRKLMI
jgi:hypothetical protein